MRDVEAKLPQWWSDPIQSAWERTRAAALADWRLRGDHATPVNEAIVEDALAFGHGARSAYSHLRTWETVCTQLRADWIQLGHVGPADWQRVFQIIQHEWRRAEGPGGDAAPAP